MPPRHAYWTIILEGKPTAFRSHTREELAPTLRQLQARHPDAVMMWFARGRLWPSPEHQRDEALRKARERESRGPAWRPGGAHRDPRERFKIPRDEKRRRFAERLRRDRFDHGDRGEREMPERPDRPERRPEWKRDNRPPRRPVPGPGDRPPWRRDEPDRPQHDRPRENRPDRREQRSERRPFRPAKPGNERGGWRKGGGKPGGGRGGGKPGGGRAGGNPGGGRGGGKPGGGSRGGNRGGGRGGRGGPSR